MAESLYEAIFYGNSFYGPGSQDVPRDLKFYRTNTDNVYTIYWGFDEAFITPVLATADFDLELDSVITFNSGNLTSFTSATAIQFQNGNVEKGFTIPVQPRLDGQIQTWYARVRTRMGLNVSGWSGILQFTIIPKFEIESSESLMNFLPDEHVYGKEDILKPVASRNTNLYTVMNMYGKEFDKVELENILTSTNNYLNLCRDEYLYDNFGILFSYRKPQTQQFVEYRECLRALMFGSLTGGTLDAVKRVIRSFTGVTPFVELIRDRGDFFLTTLFEQPPEVPNGIITHFSTSVDYIVGSLTVLKNGIHQSITTFTEDHAGPVFGFDFSVPPSPGDLIQVFFEIGFAEDPVPVVFDLTDTTTLTGTLTFTNNSTIVTGSGSLFTSELTPRTLITDSAGLIFGEVKTITDDFNLVLSQEWIGSTGSGVGKKVNFNSSTPVTGTVNFVNGSPAVTGLSTAFLTELRPGDVITDDIGVVLGVVSTIINNTQFTLVSPWGGVTASNTHTIVLNYGDTTVWDKATLGYGVVIHVFNPGNFILDHDLIEALTRPLIAAHVLSYFEYE